GRRPCGRHPFRTCLGARVASLRCPILLASISIVRHAPFRVKRKVSILENKSDKSRGFGGGAPIMKMTSSFWICAETSLPACDSRAPGAGAGGCRSGSSFPAPKQFQAGGEVAGVDQLVLERAPQPFDENIVERAAAAIHTDGDPALLERSQEVGRS